MKIMLTARRNSSRIIAAADCAFFGGVTVYCGPKGMVGAPDRLYRNEGERFVDATESSGVSAANRYYGLGVIPEDFDLDGDSDLFVANGHVYPQVDDVESGSSYRQRNQLFENLGSGDFRDVSAFAGPGMEVEKVSRGAAFGDYDNDGDVDVFIVNLNDTPTLLRSGGDEEKGSWLAVQVVASTCNRDGTGVRVAVRTGGKTQWRTINGASS